MKIKTLRILSAVFAVIALIGLVSVIAGTRNVNFGAFVFPACASALALLAAIRKGKM